MSNSEKFLSLFNEVEKKLRKLTNNDEKVSFFELVEESAEISSVVRNYKEDLKKFANLRNVIVHEFGTEKRFIAEPNDLAVSHLSNIYKNLTAPPKVIPEFQVKVEYVFINDPISSALKVMYNKSYSQLPVYEGDVFKTLLTTNTITRWLGACVNEDIFSLSETPISDVLKFTEENDNFCFIGRDSTLFDVVEEFQTYVKRGKKLDAILITQNGRPSEKLMGIITVWDLPRIYGE